MVEEPPRADCRASPSGLWQAASAMEWMSAPVAQDAQPGCNTIDESDLAAVAGCRSLEQLAGQLSAFNQHIGQRLTGRSLEENIRAGLGTAMGVTVNPARVRELQQLAKETGNPPLLFFADSERGVRTILPSSLAQSFTWNLDLVETGGQLAAREHCGHRV